MKDKYARFALTQEECAKILEEGDFIKRARASIPHPHFQYAVVAPENRTVEYKRKKRHEWLSGRRIARVKIRKLDFQGLGEYRRGKRK